MNLNFYYTCIIYINVIMHVGWNDCKQFFYFLLFFFFLWLLPSLLRVPPTLSFTFICTFTPQQLLGHPIQGAWFILFNGCVKLKTGQQAQNGVTSPNRDLFRVWALPEVESPVSQSGVTWSALVRQSACLTLPRLLASNLAITNHLLSSITSLFLFPPAYSL